MRSSLLYDLLNLAHATSQNLGFAHLPDVNVSYGEETITETNLLELRRRHPRNIELKTFVKKEESKNGADWEWHIIGYRRVFRMRVQAKRVQKDNKLKIPHKVGSSGEQQIDLLMDDAKKYGLMPVYCFYSSEDQREHWTKESAADGFEAFESGCLLASAETVKSSMPKALPEIEKDCVPWHYLVARQDFEHVSRRGVRVQEGSIMRFMVPFFESLAVRKSETERPRHEEVLKRFPTLDELNQHDQPDRQLVGVTEIGESENLSQISDEEYLERGISRLIKIDVREFPDSLSER